MTGSRAGRRYATALFELAQEQGVLEKVRDDLRKLVDVWNQSDELRSVAHNPQFGPDILRRLVGAFADRLNTHSLVKTTTQIMAERGRLDDLPSLGQSFQARLDRESGRVRAEIVSASHLSDSTVSELEKALREATGREIVVVRREDPSLIGGIVASVGSQLFDGSLRNQLRGLRNELIAASERRAGDRT